MKSTHGFRFWNQPVAVTLVFISYLCLFNFSRLVKRLPMTNECEMKGHSQPDETTRRLQTPARTFHQAQSWNETRDLSEATSSCLGVWPVKCSRWCPQASCGLVWSQEKSTTTHPFSLTPFSHSLPCNWACSPWVHVLANSNQIYHHHPTMSD